jgi:hypothetical protein
MKEKLHFTNVEVASGTAAAECYVHTTEEVRHQGRGQGSPTEEVRGYTTKEG